MSVSVTVSLVTWNSLKYLPTCLAHLRAQQDTSFELFVVDNASTDGTVEFLRQQSDLNLIELSYNSGYSEAHNQAISAASGDYVLVLNPDVFITPNFLAKMVKAMELDPLIGQVSGKLYKINDVDQVGKSQIIDSTGLFFKPNLRHFDRGAGEIDSCQYEQTEFIFGVTGAAALYRKKALDDSRVDGEYFDKDFFAYREDADLSWRMQILGWKALYTPNAIAYHIRKVQHTSKREELPSDINMHSVKNRFLMRLKNQTFQNCLHCLFPTFWRDLQVIGYILLVEHNSLPAIPAVLRLIPSMLTKRRLIFSKQRTPTGEISRWFANQPVSYPFLSTRSIP
jgi:GT2 family glycosyltransferase